GAAGPPRAMPSAPRSLGRGGTTDEPQLPSLFAPIPYDQNSRRQPLVSRLPHWNGYAFCTSASSVKELYCSIPGNSTMNVHWKLSVPNAKSAPTTLDDSSSTASDAAC